ncbi:2-phospho-L-lactate guanylyltransferase [Microcella alkalica]|uniref:2-phospho-L-lactate guanylyltransferase n=1 Tax=Microcella alkalica TaxID=355930 RepID=A0A839E4L8_9MICO|nr:2-phospho-L-lactate guanylyltransferase [Microcella alkalica]MBA8847321.1 2-phospho-L-lactate guanylyltransferase [Microcella alkalica]
MPSSAPPAGRDARGGAVRVGLVIPVRGGDRGKTRLDVEQARRSALAAAFALDTVAAARAASLVGEVVVVGALAEPVDGVRVIADPGGGLLAAVLAGLGALRMSTAQAGAGADAGAGAGPAPTAVLLGDLPALRPVELDDALAAAALHERAFVPDAEGSGTSLIVARVGVPHAPRFGPDSAARHRAAGYVELALPAGSGLRHDVDTLDQLRAVASLALGPRTRALLDD